MNKDLEYEVIIEKFDHEGRGICYIDGKITFVDDAVPGDKVIVKLVKIKKNYCIAKIQKFINYSVDRIKPICPYFDRCGGCDLQYIDYSYQLKVKENKIREILNKFASTDYQKIKSILSLSNNDFYYRNKVTFQVNKKIGLFGKNSYELVEVDKCYIASLTINKVLEQIKRNINLTNIEQIIIRNSFYDDKVMVIFVGKNFDFMNLKLISDVVDSIYLKENNHYRLIYGESYLEEKLGDYIFKISPDSFFQVNTKMCVQLYDKIIEYAAFNGNENVLDLYCGTGTIGIYISKFVNSVIGYEINEYAVKDANVNKLNNLVDNINFYCGTSELSFENITDKIDIIIVDPPRNGLNDNTIKGIINVKPCKLIYVSCDPVTLARDLKILSDFYDVLEITPVDMFPNTKHVECVCALKLR